MTETKWKEGYCINLPDGERECFQTIGGLANWIRENAQHLKEHLQQMTFDVVITVEDFDEELWEELKK